MQLHVILFYFFLFFYFIFFIYLFYFILFFLFFILFFFFFAHDQDSKGIQITNESPLDVLGKLLANFSKSKGRKDIFIILQNMIQLLN